MYLIMASVARVWRYKNLIITITITITTHLPTHEGWMAELAMLADR